MQAKQSFPEGRGQGRGASPRSHALDALRGYAIATMILSATEAFTVLPAWMYHAQVPPPAHDFNPAIYGITWVDLIFPFFLFSMGAAIPLSLGRQRQKGAKLGSLAWKSVKRYAKLVFFAIFIMHAFPFMLGYDAEWARYAVPIGAFALLCLMLMPNPFHLSARGAAAVQACAYVAATALMVWQPYAGGRAFSLMDNDVIMLILANVSLTGALVYLLTMGRPWHRLALMPFIAALFMAAHTDGSWAAQLLRASCAPWLYQPAYQEYLLVIIPGTVAGELIARWLADGRQHTPLGAGAPAVPAGDGRHGRTAPAWVVAVLALALIVLNVALLFTRQLVANVVASALVAALMAWLLRRSRCAEAPFWRRLCHAGAYLLLLGLCLEAYEGGIRKDDVTLSYLFVTCGLAFIALLLLTILCDHYRLAWLSTPLELVGKNPMVAHVSSSMVVIPVLVLAHVYPFIDAMSAQPLTGFAKGLLLTALSMGLTAWFTRRGYFWKT